MDLNKLSRRQAWILGIGACLAVWGVIVSVIAIGVLVVRNGVCS